MELAAIFTATPAEIDTELSALHSKLVELHRAIDRNIHALGQTKSEYSLNVIEVQISDLRGKSHIINDLIVALEKEFRRRGGWDRVYAVNNSNGHFHRTRACRNTYETTEWVWMPELSGLTSAEVVERTGKMSCLTCFVGQREEIEKGREATVFTPAQKKSREEQAAAAAKKAEKATAAAAKAIVNPDGTPLRTESYGVIKTVRTAWIEAVSELEWAYMSKGYIKTAQENPDDLGDKLEAFIDRQHSLIKQHCETTFHIAQAIAHKEQRDLAEILNEIVNKTNKKILKSR